MARALSNSFIIQLVAILFNLISACGIVFTNKLVFSVCEFNFAVALTCIHTLVTLIVAKALGATGVIERKQNLLPRGSVIALASAFAGYVILCNMSLSINTVGFYQLLKIAGAPTMMMMDAVATRRIPSPQITACVLLTCVGIGLATVSDAQVTTNVAGIVVGVASVMFTSQYGLWIGSMSKLHDVSSSQLLDQYLPYAAGVMSLCVVASEVANRIFGSSDRALLRYNLTFQSACLIGISSLMGAMVTFTTFAVIGYTSPLTYAVVGHVKTIVIFAGGVVMFHDVVTPVKAVGIILAMVGVGTYTALHFSTRNGKQSGGD